ncbi:MAG: holin [Candidatus Pacearchaeota archaeon]
MVEEAILISIIIGLTEVIKRLGVATKWLPLIAIGLGVALAYGGTFLGVFSKPLFLGIVCGLSACGLYDVGKRSVLRK